MSSAGSSKEDCDTLVTPAEWEMEDPYPLIAMNGYVHGQRGRGRPKKRWIDMIRDDCEAMGTTLSEASRQALDRGGWRRSIEELPMCVSTSQRH